MNSSITVDNTTSSTVSQSDSVSCFTTKYTYDFETEDGLVQLESQLKKNTYINDDILSVDDVLVFEALRQSKAIVVQKKHPTIYRWCSELEHLRRNWRLSKKKDKGSTFAEYIKNAEDKIRKEKNEKENEDLFLGMSGLAIEKKNDTTNKTDYKMKVKKLNEYKVEDLDFVLLSTLNTNNSLVVSMLECFYISLLEPYNRCVEQQGRNRVVFAREKNKDLCKDIINDINNYYGVDK